MKITLKELIIKNFKGIKDLTVKFIGNETTISGANGKCKTSIYDAFTWLLFGKDSIDRKDFDIKNTDFPELNRQDHEVEGLFIIEDEEGSIERRFKRVYREKHVKKHGNTFTEFAGHETDYFVNDAPVKLKEYEQKVSDTISEDLAKLITNPLYFNNNLTWQQRREILSKMSDISTDAEIASGNKAYTSLLASLTDKTMKQYKDEIAAKKKKLKEELDAIPTRIDEVNKSKPEIEDYEALSSTLYNAAGNLQNIEEQISNSSAAVQGEMDRIAKLQAERFAKESKLREMRNAWETEKADFGRKKLFAVKSRINDVETKTAELAGIAVKITSINDKISTLQKTNESLREQFVKISEETPVFTETDMSCPACNQAYPSDKVEELRQQAEAKYNNAKLQRLEEIRRQGRENNVQIDTLRSDHDFSIKKEQSLREEITSLNVKEDEEAAPQQPKEIEALRVELDGIVIPDAPVVDTAALKEQKESMLLEIDTLKKRLATQDQITAARKRVEELEARERDLAQQIASFDKIENTIQEFTKVKIAAIEKSVNSLFKMVRFKMYDTQINGGEVEACYAVVGNTPVNSQSHAEQVNAGLDIINSLCNYYNLYAPIFIDNRESVNTIPELKSQVINLVVTPPGTPLTIS